MVDNNGIWVRCEQCKHKLFLIYPHSQVTADIKCHSCKKINSIHIDTNLIKTEDFIVGSNYN